MSNPHPPQRCRPSAARERILDTAVGLFAEHGIRGVGVDTVIARSGVAKATLYSHFPSKDDLVLAYLDRADRAWRERLAQSAAAAGPDPGDQPIGAFDALRTACGRSGFRGCAFINTAAESVPGSAVHAATVRHKETVRDWFAELAGRAGATDPATLAVTLGILLDGGLAGTAVQSDPRIADQAQQAARTVVAAALPARTAGDNDLSVPPHDRRISHAEA